MKKRVSSGQIYRVADKIAKEYKPEKIILFGSHAWGKPHADSDVDLFVMKRTNDSVIERHKKVGRLLFGRGFPVDVLIYTPAQVKKRLQMGDFFVRNIMFKGKLLYGK